MKTKLLLAFILLLNMSANAQWVQVKTDETRAIDNISIVNDNVIWMSDQGDDSFSYTVDGGEIWTTKLTPESMGYLGGFCATNATTAYTIVSGGSSSGKGIYKTVDSGDTWNRQPTAFNESSSFPDYVYFWNENDGVAIGDAGVNNERLEIYTTSNGGDNWNRVPDSNLPSSPGYYSLNANDYFTVRGDTFYFVSFTQDQKCKIFVSNNKGTTWIVKNAPTKVSSFDFKDADNGIVIGNEGSIYSTRNGGDSWQYINNELGVLKVKYDTNNDTYLGTGRFGIASSSDNGESWVKHSTFLFESKYLSKPEISSSGKIFIGGWGDMYYSTNYSGSNIKISDATIVNPTTIDIDFSGVVEPTSAQTTDNYIVSSADGTSIIVSSATRDNTDNSIVHLSFDSPLPNDGISLTVSGVYDISGYYIIDYAIGSSVKFNMLGFDKQNLLYIYNSTDGSNWTNNTNWNTSEPLSTWHGVTVENINGEDRVTELDLRGNGLSGVVSNSIGNLSELKKLVLYNNIGINGDLPYIWSLTNLEVLSIEYTSISGYIPTNINNLTKLKQLWLSNNNLIGGVPIDFSNMPNLEKLALDRNTFEGELDLSKSTLLVYVHLESNNFAYINLQNDNNTNISDSYFNVNDNPNLKHVLVDSKGWSDTNWNNKNGITIFVDDLLGVTCETPIIADLGTNTANTTDGDQWFSYTPQKDGMLTISSASYTIENTILEVYSSCNNIIARYYNTRNNNQSEYSFEVNLGQTYYFNWKDDNSSSEFQWGLTIRNEEKGDSCDNTIVANEGNNNSDLNSNDKWYSYTAKSDGILNIGIIDASVSINIYNGCDSYLAYGYGSAKAEITNGETYQIKLRKNTELKDVNWTITERSIIAGDFCSNSIIANKDVVINTDLTTGDKWYSFTPSVSGVISIVVDANYENQTGFDMYTDCNNWIDYSYSLAKEINVEAGVTYNINWLNNGADQFSWSISMNESAEGLNCTTPIAAMENDNSSDLEKNCQWYSYTPSISGEMTVFQTNNYDDKTLIGVYSDCENRLSSNYTGNITTSVEAGQEYLIKLENYGLASNLAWNIYVTEHKAWENQITAVLGVNNLATTPNQKWYYYLATNDGILTVSSDRITNTELLINVYQQTESGWSWKSGNYNSMADDFIKVSLPVTKDKKYVIGMRIIGNSSSIGKRMNSIVWDLGYTPYAIGQSINNPSIAVIGSNSANNTDVSFQYYTFIPETNGTATFRSPQISPRSELFISDDINTEPISVKFFYNDNQEFVLMMSANKTYYLKWAISPSYKSNYDWNLAYTLGNELSVDVIDNVENRISIYPNPVVSSLNIKLNSSKINDVIIYNMLGEIILEHHDINNNEFSIELNKGSGTYIVKVTDYTGKSYNKIILKK